MPEQSCVPVIRIRLNGEWRKDKCDGNVSWWKRKIDLRDESGHKLHSQPLGFGKNENAHNGQQLPFILPSIKTHEQRCMTGTRYLPGTTKSYL